MKVKTHRKLNGDVRLVITMTVAQYEEFERELGATEPGSTALDVLYERLPMFSDLPKPGGVVIAKDSIY